MRVLRISLFLLFILCLTSYIWAKEDLNTEGPLKISSNRVVYNYKERRIEFIGKVHLVKGDLEIWCKKLEVFLKKVKNESKKDLWGEYKKENLDKIVARENVKIKMKNRLGKCEELIYFSDQDLLTLKGNVILTQDKNQIKGEIVKIYRSEDRTEILGKEKRVEVIFYPKEKKIEK